MRIFDTNVQLLKYRTLKEVIKHIYDNDEENIYLDVPKKIVPGPKATLRCCIYKERAIVTERIKMALGGDKSNPNVVEVIDIACDECPMGGMLVTSACRGCIQHACQDACPKNAITIVNKQCVINHELCIECGKCMNVCPYSAIIHQQRPCVKSCKVKAISMNEDRNAVIDNDKCIMCGACVYQCPFGAIVDKSYVTDVIKLLKESDNNKNFRMYAVIAPSIVSQFKYARIEQVITGIHKLGFHQVVEAALGADIDLQLEAEELEEKGILLSSCCPSFVMFVEKNFPTLAKYISENVSPMVQAAKLIKSSDPTAKIVFIGPCSSKKYEVRLPKTGGAIDCAISFEELQAFLDARDIDVSSLEDTALDNASRFGRAFAKSGGVSGGVKEECAKRNEDISVVAMSGIDECRANLTKLKLGKAVEKFFEGMACEGGCINGALCLTHASKNIVEVDKYCNAAKEQTTENSFKLFQLAKLK